MKRFQLSFFVPFLGIAVWNISVPLSVSAQIQREEIVPMVRSVVPEVIHTDEELNFRQIPICETEIRLRERYAQLETDDLIKELMREDSVFNCLHIRGTNRLSTKRGVITGLILEKKDTAFPQLIKLVKKGDAEWSGKALEMIQYADSKLLREYRDVFIKKSESEDVRERNRSLYILQRIRDEHIEEVMIKRWNAMSDAKAEELSKTSTLNIMFELMLYGRSHQELLEESILLTLREKKLSSRAMTDYLYTLSSTMSHEHAVEIDQAVIELLMKTKDGSVADRAANVLSYSQMDEARLGLIRALDRKNDTIRGSVVYHLVHRGDFEIIEQKELLARILSDESEYVINRVSGPLSWKYLNNEQSAVIVQCLLNDLSISKKTIPHKVTLMMNYYVYLDEATRESLSVDNSEQILKAIERSIGSDYGTIQRMTERVFNQTYGEGEMHMTVLEFWKKELERQ